ncbi:MAG: vanadium-dependent haloperoxidase [Saprospiraceae bacterium]|nr:vanadium-dependent haloperoxidase [Saprospiraceae bacterium]MBK8450697.1 vanadium-dependent haloperoxidase [Saprospiraceae bacterium]MBK8485225.1 vanadium-dependent haloperoxidase [Saprospiraceae bacterium]MBK9222442.1 vanadium-dependent haloperoxidase [Saprospiraceae bacterium]MBK9727494.1 vanadium-dependent haloperoxidase [Saprospiraceae bacterium]
MRHLVQFKASPVNFCLMVALLFLAACTKDDRTIVISELSKTNLESGKIATDWMNLSLQLTSETPGYTSPIASRVYAYLGLAIYETVVLGIDQQASLQGKLNGLPVNSLPIIYEGGEVNWSVAVNESMNYLLTRYYRNAPPAGVKKIQDLYKENVNAFSTIISPAIFKKSSQFGEMMGKAIHDYSMTDGQDEAYLNNYPTSYSAPKGQGLWSPTSSQIKKPLLPYWGEVRTFLSSSNDLEMGTPPSYSTSTNSVFYAYALDVRNRVKNLDELTENMVKYWNDDQDRSISTSGHMMAIMISILTKENKDLAFTAKAFVKLGIGIHDATVTAWRVKYKYNMQRPETYIKENIDGDFISLINSQATPEYSASPSSVAMTSAEIFSDLFGFNYAFTDRTHEFRKDINGSPRSYKTFQQMADEINMSSLYGGIHYRFSLEAGQKQGTYIGKSINRLTM